MYKIILFDLDETLVDFTHSETISLEIIYQRYYSMIDFSEFLRLFKAINASLWDKVGLKENALTPSDVSIMRFMQLNQQLGVETPFVSIADDYETCLGEHAAWLPNVKPIIESLHRQGYILGIVTNGLIKVQERKYNRLELWRWFDCYTVSDSAGVAKPHPEIFDIALQSITNKRNLECIDKSIILMVGDSLVNDGYGARDFGIDFCYVGQGQKPDELPIKYMIKSVAELMAVINVPSFV